MTRHLEIKNWNDYQHYKANKPAWVKWYRDITNDLGWLAMEDAGKLLFPYMLLVAAENENQIPDDAALISVRLRLKIKIVQEGMASLIDSGFLHIVHGDVDNSGCSIDSECLRREETEKRREETDRRRLARAAAHRILLFLNKRAGRNYRAVTANITPIIARMKEGATEDECLMIVGRKALEWESDEKMCKYLRPATLFNKTKFWQYHGEIGGKV